MMHGPFLSAVDFSTASIKLIIAAGLLRVLAERNAYAMPED